MGEEESKIGKAVAAVLECRTITEAARRLSISTLTLHRWMKKPIFQKQLRAASKKAFHAARSRAMATLHATIDELRKGLEHAPLRDKIAAAKLLYEIAKGAENHAALIEEMEKLRKAIHGERSDAAPHETGEETPFGVVG